MKKFPKYESFFSMKKRENSFLEKKIDLQLRLNIKQSHDFEKKSSL
jgi:hypothetical protein